LAKICKSEKEIFMRKIVSLTFVFLALILHCFSQTTSTKEIEDEIFKLINQERVEKKLKPLRWDDDLAKVAQIHSQNMVKFKFFSHVDNNKHSVVERMKSAGIKQWKAIGENIGYLKSSRNVAALLCQMWMKSKPHRKNIFNDEYEETGIGIAATEDGTYYITQIFIKR